MAISAFAAPIPANKMDQWRRFVHDLNGSRKAEFIASRKKLKLHERPFHQHTPQGDMAIITLEGDDPATTYAKFGQGSDPFTLWFRQQVLEIHGVDIAAPPKDPPPTLIVESV